MAKEIVSGSVWRHVLTGRVCRVVMVKDGYVWSDTLVTSERYGKRAPAYGYNARTKEALFRSRYEEAEA